MYGFVRSPGPVAWAIFAVYLVVLAVGSYYVLQVFRREEILLGHLERVFEFLTEIRIWSIRHRVSYTAVVSAVLVGVFLVLVYWAEQLHYQFYGVDPLFASPSEFVVWITVLAISGLERGSGPRSLLGVVLTGVFPIFVIGSIFTIVRYTSEDAHDRLVGRMARGDLAPYRVVVVNYRERYADFVRAMLERSDAFLVLFAKEDALPEAERLKRSFETTSRDEYRLMIEELTYSADQLFDRYDVVGSDELYVFPDTEVETDYRNLQFVTAVNDAVERAEEHRDDDRVPCPTTVWHTTDANLTEISSRLSSPTFQANLHAMSFQSDVDSLVDLNLGNAVERLDAHFNLRDDEDAPPWVRGCGLDAYGFEVVDLTDAEFAALADLHRERTRSESNVESHDDKRALLHDIEERVTALGAETGDVGPFYGVIVDVAGRGVPIDPATAYGSYQFETARGALRIGRDRDRDADRDERRDRDADAPVGDVFVVNYNDNIDRFLRTFDAERGIGGDVVVLSADDQVTPETSDAVRYVTYGTVSELLDFLFRDESLGGVDKRLETGDSILIFLDHGAAEPQVNALMVLNGVDEKLSSDAIDATHNDVFLGVETPISDRSEKFNFLSVDKEIETFRTQHQFLNNLATLWTSDPVREAVREGDLDSREAFDWAVRTADYLREYRIAHATEVYHPDDPSQSVVGDVHHELPATLRDLDGGRPQPFVSFRLRRDRADAAIAVEFQELTRDRVVGDDEYLLFLPYL